MNDDLDEAIDTVAAMLRAMVQHPIRVSTLDPSNAADAERWARHILTRIPSPQTPESQAGTATVRREWLGVRRYFLQLRRLEAEHAARALEDLRRSVWAFVQSVGRMIAQEAEDGQELAEHLNTLRRLIDAGSTEELKRGAAVIATSLENLFARKQRRQTEELERIRNKVMSLGTDLAEARRQSELDSLTSLANRRTFDHVLARTTDLCSVLGKVSCLLLIDIDHFKAINDAHGHPAGDAVLKALAGCLVANFKRGHDLVARVGGEEFAAILADCNDVDGLAIAERLQQSVRSLTVLHAGKAMQVTASVGVARSIAGESSGAWYARADSALYSAKQQGRNRIVVA